MSLVNLGPDDGGAGAAQGQQQQQQQQNVGQGQGTGQGQVQSRPAGSTFNFQHFLEKMRQPSAGELVSSIKSFIYEQSKQNSRKLLVSEYERLIQDFLAETTSRLAGHELWKEATDDELDDAAEGLEKYLMNKMYKQCFQPARSDDVERDQALTDRLNMFSFVRPHHLDMPDTLCAGDGFLQAQQELCKIDSYKAPRDKMICVLNSCKIINSLLTNSTDKAVGADEFFPLLVYIVISGKPPNLYSNLQFIRRFRNPEKLQGEAGYYFTTLSGAVEFAQTMGPKEMTIDPEEFERELTKALTSSDELNIPAEGAGGVEKGDPAPLISLGTGHTPPPPGTGAGGLNSSVQVPSISGVMGVNASPSPAPSSELADVLGTLSSLGGSNSAAAVAARRAATSPTGEFSAFVGASGGGLASASAVMGSLVDLSSAGVGSTGAGTASPGTNSSSNGLLGEFGGSSTSSAGPAAGPASPGTPGLFGEHTEVLHALHEPVVTKFLSCSVEDLQMGDIPVLLADYKRIAGLQSKLQQFFKQQGFVFGT